MDKFLVDMIAHVERQYFEIEKECFILRKLLKPWPKKKQVDQEKSIQAVKTSDDHDRKEKSSLTPREKEALEEMDRLLYKAQKVIKIKEKVTDTAQSTVSNSNISINDSGTDINEIKEIKENIEDNTANKTSVTKASGNVDERSKSKCVTQRKREVSLIKNNPPKTKVSSLSLAKEMKSSQQVSSATRLPSSRSITPRPLSSANSSRPSSGRSRYTPAHINAPFKTDVNARVPHRKNNHIYKNHLYKASHKKITPDPAQKYQPQLNSLKTLPKIAPVGQDNKSDSDSINPDLDDKETMKVDDINFSEGTHFVQVSDCCGNIVQGSAGSHGEEFLGEESKFYPKVSNHDLKEVSGFKEQSCLKSEEFFSLKDKSSKLKVPHRFHKLVAENHTLLEKCSTAKIVKKMPNTDAALHFVERLNETNEVSQELWAKAKALTCLQSHQLMLKSLSSLGIEAMSETTSFETVYRAKKLLEFILSKFAQTQDEADFFSKVQFRPSPSSRITAATPLSSDETVIGTLFKNQDFQLAGHNVMDKFVMDALTSSKAWTHLQFEKNIRQLQLHLMCLSETEWWDIVCQEPENGGIVQIIHSLLTSSGEFLPTIVQNPYS